jgi:molecular chaperone Hsp33
MTQDGQFRVIAVSMADTCAEAARRQHSPPGNRVQIIIKDPSGHRLVADSLPDGKNRSIVNPGRPGDSRIAATGLLQVHYTLRSGELHQGIVALQENDTVSQAIMRYLQESEQIAAFVSIECVVSEDGLRAVGGFVVQVTPEATHEGLSEMTSYLETFDSLEPWLGQPKPDPEVLIAKILKSHEYAILAKSVLSFGCTCSMERMVLGLSTLARAEIAELLKEGKPVETSCDACGEQYEVSTEQLAELLGAGEASDSDDLPN